MRFDYGRIENNRRYGQATPPRIPLEDFDIPVALFQGSLDKLADPTDVEWLTQQISNKVVFRQMYELGHMSFAMAKDMTWFKEDVVQVMNMFKTNVYAESSYLQ